MINRSVASRQRLIAFALSVGGYIVGGYVLWIALTGPFFDWTGDVGRLFDPVGDALRAGRPVYAGGPGRDPFFYAPPWAVLFASVSWVPIEVLYAGISVANVAALRYLAGSWLAVGWCFWFPLVPLTINTGNMNLLMAGAIVAGVRGSAFWPTLLASAKISPALALDPRKWRGVVVTALVLCSLTVPWLHLWPEWATQLATYAGSGIGPQIPIPLIVRLPVAVVLLLLWRPWSRALAAVVAIPGFYWESLVCLLAPVAVWLRGTGRADDSASGSAPALSSAPVVR